MQAYIGALVPHYNEGNTKNICLQVYFSGCNFRCGYCNVPEFLTFDEKHLIDLKDVKQELRLHHKVITSVMFTGGEPCLQKDAVLQLAQFAKMLSMTVLLDTNGSRPDVLFALLENELVDVVYLDMKTPFYPDLFEKVTRAKTFFVTPESLLLNIQQSITHLIEFRDTVDVVVVTPIIPQLLYRKEDLFVIAAQIQSFASRWILRRFHNDKLVVDKSLQKLKEPTYDFVEMLRDGIIKKYPRLVVEVE